MKKSGLYIASLAFLILLQAFDGFEAGAAARKRVYNILDSRKAGQFISLQDTVPVPQDSSLALPSTDTVAVQDTIDMSTWIDPELLKDSLFLSLLDLDEETERIRDSLEAEYYVVLGTDLPDEKDIRKAERQNKKDARIEAFLSKPRILDTYLIPDSLYYHRLLMWTHSQNSNKIILKQYDTSYNYHFNDFPFYKEDVNATYLGVAGSAAQKFNYFKRQKLQVAPFFEPYLDYAYTPETAVMYNVKTPYTELAYSGTTFAVRTKEEQNVRVLTTFNVTPEMNVKLLYQKLGGAGMLNNENTANKSWDLGVNYLGNRYELHFGFLGQSVARSENGGVSDIYWVRDTMIDKKVVPVSLSNASNNLKRNTVFLTHSIAVPMNFFRKDKDSLEIGEGTMAFIGHSLEYSSYSKTYIDKLSNAEMAFYDNISVMDKSKSYDSLSVKRFENKLFVNLQPFAKGAILSEINAGIGYQMLGFYSFDPNCYIKGNRTEWHYNTYVYGGVNGQFKKYFQWDADLQYNLSGYYAGDFKAGANIAVSVFPFDGGINLKVHGETATTTPHPFEQKLYFNHHQWDNNFVKSNETRLQASLTIPKWDVELFAGYSVTSNKVYYDSLTIIRQAAKPVNIFSAYLQKNFNLGILHLDNRLLFQTSSNEDVVPLPKFSANLKYYIQFAVVKNVMNMQIGANALITTPYRYQGYCPDLGVFYNQNRETLRTNPYIDLFVNVQWKKASVFIKLENVAYGWPNKEYFSADRYIRTDRALKIGIYWPFY